MLWFLSRSRNLFNLLCNKLFYKIISLIPCEIFPSVFPYPISKVNSSMARILPVENLLPRNVCGQLSTTSTNLLKQPNGELLVAVYHNQLRTMASETVDKVGWSHPHPQEQYSQSIFVHSINQ